jgi:hypothetical protein
VCKAGRRSGALFFVRHLDYCIMTRECASTYRDTILLVCLPGLAEIKSPRPFATTLGRLRRYLIIVRLRSQSAGPLAQIIQYVTIMPSHDGQSTLAPLSSSFCYKIDNAAFYRNSSHARRIKTCANFKYKYF